MGTTADDAEGPPNGGEMEETTALISILDTLAHLWSRPVAAEVRAWDERHSILLNRPKNVDEALELLREHDRLFVGFGDPPCPPYESVWRRLATSSTSDLRRFAKELRQLYRTLGLESSTSHHGELDHIAVEMEATAFALSRQATRPIARQLVLHHMSEWVPELCQSLSVEAQLPFYRDLAKLTGEVVPRLSLYFRDSDGNS